MNHAITVGDLVHWSLFAVALISLVGGVGWCALLILSTMDAPERTPAWLPFAVLALPTALFVAWWLT